MTAYGTKSDPESAQSISVFHSTKTLEHIVATSLDEVRYEELLMHALEKSREDFAFGRCYASRNELVAAVARKRSSGTAACAGR